MTTSFWTRHSKHCKNVLAALFTVVAGTLFMAGAGVLMYSPIQTPWTAVVGGALVSVSIVTGSVTLHLAGFVHGN